MTARQRAQQLGGLATFFKWQQYRLDRRWETTVKRLRERHDPPDNDGLNRFLILQECKKEDR